MGLAGRKVKQRIPNDPRNLAWSENAAKFGHTYLAKLGWNPTLGHGLGVAKDGRTTNIAVAQKLDQLGIGAGRGAGGANDKDGVAWKQQNDFEMMLARLNQQTIEGTTEGEVKEGVVAALGFVASSSAPQDLAGFEVAEASASSSSSKKEKKDKKRKRSELETDEGLSKSTTSEATSSTTAAAAVLVAPAPRRFAHHRARLLNAKKISSKSAAELSEVLGIASTPGSSSSTSTPTPGMGALTPISDEPDVKITTSTKSMSDYFKEKMAKMKNKHQWMDDGTGDNTPNNGDGTDAVMSSGDTATTPTRMEEEEDDRPRLGLGAARRAEGSSPSAFVAPSFQPSTAATTKLSSNSTVPKTSTPSFAPSSFSKLTEATSSSSSQSPPADPSPSTLLSRASSLDDPSSSKTGSRKNDKSEKKSKKRSKTSTLDSDDTDNNTSKSKKKRKDKVSPDDVEAPLQSSASDSPGVDQPPPKKKKKRSKDSAGDDAPMTVDDEAKRRKKEEKKAKKRAKEGKA